MSLSITRSSTDPGNAQSSLICAPYPVIVEELPAVQNGGSRAASHRRPHVADRRVLARQRPAGRAAGAQLLPGGAGEVGGDDVGRVPVQGRAGPVVAHGGPRVGVGSSFLDVAQRDAGVEGRR